MKGLEIVLVVLVGVENGFSGAGRLQPLSLRRERGLGRVFLVVDIFAVGWWVVEGLKFRVGGLIWQIFRGYLVWIGVL